MSSWPETGDASMSSHSNSVTLLLHLPTSAWSWTASLLPIPLWPHWWKSQQCQALVLSVAPPLQGKHHLSCNKALLRARSQSIHQHFPHQWAGSPMQPTQSSHNPRWDLQEQALSFQDQAHNSTLNQSVRPFLPSDFLTQFSLSLGTPTLGHHLSLNQQQHPQAAVATGLPGATQDSTMDGTFYSRVGQATLLAMGSLPYSSQSATSAPSMPTDIPTMAKVIPNGTSETTAENYTGCLYRPF